MKARVPLEVNILVSAETDEEGEVLDMTSSEESDSQTDNSEGTPNH